LNPSLFLSTYYFFPLYWIIPNDLKNFKHVANLPWKMNPKKHHHFEHFTYKCNLVKCNFSIFRRAKKMIFVTSNANILQSTWWKFLNIFPRLLKPSYYRILWLHMSKKCIFSSTRNGSFWVFLVKTYGSQGNLRVKKIKFYFQFFGVITLSPREASWQIWGLELS